MIRYPSLRKNRIQVKVIEIYIYKQGLWEYNPRSISHKNQASYVLSDGDHIYVLSQELKSLQQTMNRESEGHKLHILPVGKNYVINPKPQTPKYIMIENEDGMYNEIITLDTEEKKDEEITINAIHRGDNLERVLWNLVIYKDYIPTVEFNAGNITG